MAEKNRLEKNIGATLFNLASFLKFYKISQLKSTCIKTTILKSKKIILRGEMSSKRHFVLIKILSREKGLLLLFIIVTSGVNLIMHHYELN